jgi:hypothetical protein
MSRLAVYLLDTAQLPAARSAIEAVFGSSRVPAAGVHALPGQYAVSQLKAWTERAGTVLKMPGVTLVDLDEAKNRIAIGVEEGSRTRASAVAAPASSHSRRSDSDRSRKSPSRPPG